MAGGFRGRGQESNARHIIGVCNCRVLDALAGGFRGCGIADRQAMRGILLGNATADFETHWQESSGVALRDSRDFNRKVQRKLRFQ